MNLQNKEKVSINKKFKNKSMINTENNVIFNYKYDNNYYRSNKKSSTFKKENNSNIYISNKKKPLRNNIIKINKEKKFPGYYNLIQIDANNSLKNKPPESKYILDNYNYEEATKYETRDFWRIYFICLLSKENILNTFFFKAPLESQPIRISLFIFCYSCDFALNAFFYLNEKISDIYHYEGDSLYFFILVNNLTISIFSTVFSYLLVKLLNIMTNSKKHIEYYFKEEEQKMRKNKKYKVDYKRKKEIYNNILEVFKVMKIKLICYIILEFLIMFFFLYFITAFCEVYRDTQKSLIYDSFISFLISILIELLISFCISLLYTAAIKFHIKILYNIVLFSYKLG